MRKPGRTGQTVLRALLALAVWWQLGSAQAQLVAAPRVAGSSDAQYLYVHNGQRRQQAQLVEACHVDAAGNRQCVSRHCLAGADGLIPAGCFGAAGSQQPLPEPPTPGSSGGDASKYITHAQYRRIFKHTHDVACNPGFFTYKALKTALAAFPRFANEGGSDAANKRELAAFLAQVAHETSAAFNHAPGGPFAWGLCQKEDPPTRRVPGTDYCAPHPLYPCSPGKSYHGRGALRLAGSHNYGAAGEALGVDILSAPELVAERPVLAFKTALWRWMAPLGGRPSCHDAITGRLPPAAADAAAGRQQGFGWVTNILNGEEECGLGYRTPAEASRIGHYRRVAAVLGVRLGNSLHCINQRPYSVPQPPVEELKR